MATRVAMAACKPEREDAAAEVGAQLVLDIGGEGARILFARLREKGLQVIADDAIKDRVSGPTRKVGGGEAKSIGTPKVPRLERTKATLPPS